MVTILCICSSIKLLLLLWGHWKHILKITANTFGRDKSELATLDDEAIEGTGTNASALKVWAIIEMRNRRSML